ncbi:MAG: EAL domain-containing protein [Candidatus Ruminococcus intestinipullorum]|nr:EAL domain-containing protein [Candidatus Ruminococcus intestinipullorum]
MSDRKVNKGFEIFSCLTIVVAITFFIGGIFLSKLLNTAQEEWFKSYLNNQAKIQEIHVERQHEADLQTLNTTKHFIDFQNTNLSEILKVRLDEANESNKFIRMSLVYPSGAVYHATLNKGVSEERVEDLEPELKRIVEKSFSGEEEISDVYYEDDIGQNVIAISVPVKEDGKVVGVLVAYNSEDVYTDILKSNKDGETYTYIIEDTGEMLVDAGEFIDKQEIESVYEMKIKESQKAAMREHLERGEDFFTVLEMGENKYCAFLLRTEFQNWYVLTIREYNFLQNKLISYLNYFVYIYAAIILIGCIFVGYTISIFRKNNKRLERIAYYDELTGIYNLHKFQQDYKNIIEENRPLSVVILNIKNFQFINETFGEARADSLLKFFAYVMQKEIREGEYCCRDSADQFMMLLRDVDQKEVARRVGIIERQILNYFEDDQTNYNIRLSIGGYIGDRFSKYSVNNAILAMKEAKNSNAGIVFYDAAMKKSVELQNEITNSMYDALENEEFKLHLQPKYDIEKECVIGAEALVRWIKKDGTQFFPDQFIPLFEKNGFCIQLDLYMVEQVCKKLRQWIDEGYEVHPVSVNQTKLLFYRKDYVDNLCEITTKYNIDPNLIVLEILEGLALENVDLFNDCIEKLHEKGFRVSLDDFGSGYASLGNLNELHVDEIKVDRTLLELLEERKGPQKNKMFEKIMRLIESLEVDTIIEGVETQTQIEVLRKLNCRFVQGYYYSRPVSAQEYEKFLKAKL